MDGKSTQPPRVAAELPPAQLPPPPWTTAAEAGWPDRAVSSPVSQQTPAVAWPRSAQILTAGLLVLAVGLLGWNVFAASRWATRPTTLVTNVTLAFRVELNRADHAQLLQLPGVGETLASRIVEHRQSHGPFRSIEDLRKVGGVGPALLARLRPFVYVEVTGGEEAGVGESALVVRSVRAVAGGEKQAGRDGATDKPAVLRAPVDVNRADPEDLRRLPGIGPVLAARIVGTRGVRPFRSVEDLRRVPGIGPKTLGRLRPFVVVGDNDRPATP